MLTGKNMRDLVSTVRDSDVFMSNTENNEGL